MVFDLSWAWDNWFMSWNILYDKNELHCHYAYCFRWDTTAASETRAYYQEGNWICCLSSSFFLHFKSFWCHFSFSFCIFSFLCHLKFIKIILLEVKNLFGHYTYLLLTWSWRRSKVYHFKMDNLNLDSVAHVSVLINTDWLTRKII